MVYLQMAGGPQWVCLPNLSSIQPIPIVPLHSVAGGLTKNPEALSVTDKWAEAHMDGQMDDDIPCHLQFILWTQTEI